MAGFSHARCLACSALSLAALAGPGASRPTSADASRPAHLSIASLNLGDGANQVLAAKPKREAAWRTSFGSERMSEEKPPLDSDSVQADVVLLQGVTAIRIARALFPARNWKLIVSRQLLTRDESEESGSGTAVAVPLTAVAVRYQEGLRVTGQEHILAPSSPATGDGSGAASPGSAATAVRLLIGPRTIWVLSLDLSPAWCTPAEPGCREPKALADWRRDKAEASAVMVLGGRLSAREEGALPPPPCLHQELSAIDPAGASEGSAIGQPAELLGCLARLEIATGG